MGKDKAKHLWEKSVTFQHFSAQKTSRFSKEEPHFSARRVVRSEFQGRTAPAHIFGADATGARPSISWAGGNRPDLNPQGLPEAKSAAGEMQD